MPTGIFEMVPPSLRGATFAFPPLATAATKLKNDESSFLPPHVLDPLRSVSEILCPEAPWVAGTIILALVSYRDPVLTSAARLAADTHVKDTNQSPDSNKLSRSSEMIRARSDYFIKLLPELSDIMYSLGGLDHFNELAARFGYSQDMPEDPIVRNHLVRDLHQVSCLVGTTDKIQFSRKKSTLFITDCNDTTIFVTARFSTVIIQRCTRSTIAIVPATSIVSLSDCSGCTLSVAAPVLHASNIIGTLIFGSSRHPILFSDESRDITLGPYNCAGFGVPEALVDAVGDPVAACRLASNSTQLKTSPTATELPSPDSVVTLLPPSEIYFRHLPIIGDLHPSASKGVHDTSIYSTLPPVYAKIAMEGIGEGRKDDIHQAIQDVLPSHLLTGSKSSRAEHFVQTAFVVSFAFFYLFLTLS